MGIEWFSSWQEWELNLVTCLCVVSAFALVRVERRLRDLERELKERPDRRREHPAHERRERPEQGSR